MENQIRRPPWRLICLLSHQLTPPHPRKNSGKSDKHPINSKSQNHKSQSNQRQHKHFRVFHFLIPSYFLTNLLIFFVNGLNGKGLSFVTKRIYLINTYHWVFQVSDITASSFILFPAINVQTKLITKNNCIKIFQTPRIIPVTTRTTILINVSTLSPINNSKYPDIKTFLLLR